jgi:hypothetical protein
MYTFDFYGTMKEKKKLDIASIKFAKYKQNIYRRFKMGYEYKMVQIPPNIIVKSKDWQGQEAAYYLQELVDQYAAQGWEFYRVDTIGIVRKPGCLASLFGKQAEFFEYYVVTFRRQK